MCKLPRICVKNYKTFFAVLLLNARLLGDSEALQDLCVLFQGAFAINMWGRLCFVNMVNLLCNTFRKIFWFDTKYHVPTHLPTMDKPFYGSRTAHQMNYSIRNLAIANCSHKTARKIESALVRLKSKPRSRHLFTSGEKIQSDLEVDLLKKYLKFTVSRPITVAGNPRNSFDRLIHSEHHEGPLNWHVRMHEGALTDDEKHCYFNFSLQGGNIVEFAVK